MQGFVNRKDKRLKPCPLCGGQASITSPTGSTYNIHCGTEDDWDNECSLVLFGDKEKMSEMIEKWNRRHG